MDLKGIRKITPTNINIKESPNEEAWQRAVGQHVEDAGFHCQESDIFFISKKDHDDRKLKSKEDIIALKRDQHRKEPTIFAVLPKSEYQLDL